MHSVSPVGTPMFEENSNKKGEKRAYKQQLDLLDHWRWGRIELYLFHSRSDGKQSRSSAKEGKEFHRLVFALHNLQFTTNSSFLVSFTHSFNVPLSLLPRGYGALRGCVRTTMIQVLVTRSTWLLICFEPLRRRGRRVAAEKVGRKCTQPSRYLRFAFFS